MSANKLRIRVGDVVQVISGGDRGKTGKVLRVDPESRKLAVEGVAVVKRHARSQGDQPGGIVHKEAMIDISNVALWDAKAGARVKVGYAEVDGKKVRVNRKTGAPV